MRPEPPKGQNTLFQVGCRGRGGPGRPPTASAELLEVSDTKSMEEGDTTDPMEMY